MVIMTIDVLPAEPETFSLFGKPLYRAPMREEIYEAQKKRYEEAYKNYKADPEDTDNIIWLGRRLAYLGRYREACAIFTIGHEEYPEDARFLRHRGHRFLTLRRFDNAIEDFLRAAELMDPDINDIEPDGIPNDRNQPISSLQTNVWYHLGLGYFLKGEYEKAAKVYAKGIKQWEIPDKYASFGNWYYQTLRHLGRDEKAKKVLEKASPELELLENRSYLDLLLMFKGEKQVEELEEKMKDSGLALATQGYGVAFWHLISSEEDKAVRLLEKILKETGWASFGYIAAEALYKRLGYTL